MWKRHYWPTLDHIEPLFVDEITDDEIEQYAGWTRAWNYPTCIQFERKPEVVLLTLIGNDHAEDMAGEFYRGITVRRIGAEMRVAAKRAARMEVGQ